MLQKWPVREWFTHKLALGLLAAFLVWFIVVRFNVEYFTPPDTFGGYFIGTTDSYQQLLSTYTRHESMPFHPVYVFYFYAFITVVWFFLARGWKKIWTLALIGVTFLAFIAVLGVGISDGTELKHLDTFTEENHTYHLFKEESLSSGADVYQEFLYLAICTARRQNCVFRPIAFDVFLNGKKVSWQKEAGLLKVFVEGVSVFEHQLQPVVIPSQWPSFRSDELGLAFQYPLQVGNQTTSVRATAMGVILKVGEGKTAVEKVVMTPFSKDAVRHLKYDEKVSTHYIQDGNTRCELIFPQRINKAGHFIVHSSCHFREKNETGHVLFDGGRFYFIPDQALDLLTPEEKDAFLESLELLPQAKT
ncbi:MAG TPA: hypothetical protein VD999_01845 [Vitreimonas sp.]|nr:hypothetical protein [Vitreimonas sp.]